MESKIPLQSIDQPSQLMLAFPQHVLTIHSKAHASRKWSIDDKVRNVPEGPIYLRYEPDTNMLYVDRALFMWAKAPELSKKLRCNTQFCGAKPKRMQAGIKTYNENSVRTALVFDLNRINALRANTRQEEKRARMRPLDHAERAVEVIKHAETTFDRAHAAYKRVEKQLDQVRKEMNSPGNAHLPAYWFEAKKEIRSVLEEVYFILDIGKNLHAEVVDLAHRYNAPLRRVSKRLKRSNPYAPKNAPRVRIEAFDKMIGIEAVYIYRERFYWSDKTGSLMEHKKEFVPDTDATLWSGYYKEWSFSDGTGVQKWLWIPVALLNTYTHKDSTILSPEEKEQLKFYRTDIRYVSTEVKRIGGKAHRCAKFDMRRSVNPAKEEPPRTPEKNKHKSA